MACWILFTTLIFTRILYHREGRWRNTDEDVSVDERNDFFIRTPFFSNVSTPSFHVRKNRPRSSLLDSRCKVYVLEIKRTTKILRLSCRTDWLGSTSNFTTVVLLITNLNIWLTSTTPLVTFTYLYLRT